MQTHDEAVELYSNPTRSIVLATVVVGTETVEFENDAPQVIARAVPLSVNLNSSKSPSDGVPVKLVDMLVMAVAKPV